MGIDSEVIPIARQVVYGTYAGFPTTGLTVGDLAWATDRKCLYRWSGSAWESVGISSRHGLYANMGNAADYPESSLYQADDKNLIYMVISGAWQQVTVYGGLPPWEVGDITVISADTERANIYLSYTKIKEIAIASAGIIRVSFDLRIQTGTYTAYGRIYKNDVAFGTERTTTSTSYVTFSEDLSFNASDLVQLYYKTSNGGAQVYCRNFKLNANRIHLHKVNTD